MARLNFPNLSARQHDYWTAWATDLRDGRVLFFNVFVAITLYIVGKLAFQLATVNDVTPVWPLSGISLAALLISRFRVLPGMFIGYWILDITLYQSWALGMTIGTGEAVEAIIAALLIQRWNGAHSIVSRVRYTFLFAIAVSLAPVFNATLGTSLLYGAGTITQADYASVWRTWWTADTVGFLVFAPFLLVWQRGFKGMSTTVQHIGELVLLISLTALTSWQTFGQSHPLEYVFLLPMVWAAFRFGQRGSTLLVVCLSIISVLATAQGAGIFAQTAPAESMLLVQSFVGVVSLTILILSSTISQQQTAERQLKQTNELLESRVVERTAKLTQAMEDLRKTQTQLVQTEKMSSLGQLVAGVAHEINNPVNFIHGNISHARDYANSLLELVDLFQQDCHQPSQRLEAAIADLDLPFVRDDLPRLLQSMQVGSERIREIVKALRNFSRLDEAEFKDVNVHEGIDSTLMILHNRIKEQSDRPGVHIIKEYGDLPLIECYPGQLNQVFMNILSNAIDAVEDYNRGRSLAEIQQEPGKIKIQTQLLDHQWVAIHIANTGNPIPENVRSRIFDPFFTTKPVGQGTGMGLAISHQIVTEKHNGLLSCRTIPEFGTEFVINIPLRQPRQSSQQPSEHHADAPNAFASNA